MRSDFEREKEALQEIVNQALYESPETNDEALHALIGKTVEEHARRTGMPVVERMRMTEELYNGFKRLDILQELIDDPKVTEIMINSAKDIFIEKDRKIRRWDAAFSSTEKLEDIIQLIVSRINRRVNTSSPIVDARLPDGSRVHVVLPPIALDGPVLTIRKFPEKISIRHLIRFGSLTEEAASYLKMLVTAGYNLFISGGTGSGKTTFLNALSAYIPKEERIITIEDSAELQITHVPNIVRLETRDANSEGHGRISMGDLIKASLRMRPDRIIVGEVRDYEAVTSLIYSMNTGHSGSMSTGHANSTRDMLTRLESLMLTDGGIPLEAVRMQLASALEILVHLERLPDGRRQLVEITELCGMENGKIVLNTLFRFDQKTGMLERCGVLKNRNTLQRTGIPVREEYL